MKKLLLIVAVAMLLPACGSKTAEYYEKHPEEMRAKIEACGRMSQAEKMADRECAAVNNVISKRFFKSTIKENPLQGPGNGPGIKQF
ncbi:MAG: EexN family lipoprotein [Syntrophobacterales bacterium]|jgi:PBP1b-binding outer membrane lipoprotein LpoB|nr:EexN family lipoprotein [Syntrophobacterales bacterium]